MAKTVSNEELVAALLAHTTVKAAAESLGITPRTVYSMMADWEFKRLYDEAKADLLSEATQRIREHMTSAIDTIAEIMEDEKTNPSVRLTAAQAILKHCEDFSNAEYSLRDRAERQEEKSLFNGMFVDTFKK